jgi:ISXO2-like transposase domain
VRDYGVYHSMSGKHLRRYLDEFTFRLNEGNVKRHSLERLDSMTRSGQQTTPKDFIVEPITLKKGLVGAKPPKVCRWILDLLNARAGDEIVDLFPGTGIMGKVAQEVGLSLVA